jgi:hypothetical protein
MRTCGECLWCDTFELPKLKAPVFCLSAAAEKLFFPDGHPPEQEGIRLGLLCTHKVPGWVDSVTDTTDLDGGRVAEHCPCFSPKEAPDAP